MGHVCRTNLRISFRQWTSNSLRVKALTSPCPPKNTQHVSLGVGFPLLADSKTLPGVAIEPQSMMGLPNRPGAHDTQMPVSEDKLTPPSPVPPKLLFAMAKIPKGPKNRFVGRGKGVKGLHISGLSLGAVDPPARSLTFCRLKGTMQGIQKAKVYPSQER